MELRRASTPNRRIETRPDPAIFMKIAKQAATKPQGAPLAYPQRLKILELRHNYVVLIRWLQSGHRLEETVPYQQARRRRLELEAQGAVVYWSERLVHHS